MTSLNIAYIEKTTKNITTFCLHSRLRREYFIYDHLYYFDDRIRY